MFHRGVNADNFHVTSHYVNTIIQYNIDQSTVYHHWASVPSHMSTLMQFSI